MRHQKTTINVVNHIWSILALTLHCIHKYLVRDNRCNGLFTNYHKVLNIVTCIKWRRIKIINFFFTVDWKSFFKISKSLIQNNLRRQFLIKMYYTLSGKFEMCTFSIKYKTPSIFWIQNWNIILHFVANIIS